MAVAELAPPAPDTSTEQTEASLKGGALGLRIKDIYERSVPLYELPDNNQLEGEAADPELVAQIDAAGGLLNPIIIVMGPMDTLSDVTGNVANLGAGRRRIQAVRALYERDAALYDTAQRDANTPDNILQELSYNVSRWENVRATVVVSADEGVSTAELVKLVDHSTRRDNDAVTYIAIHRLMAAGFDIKRVMEATGIDKQTAQRIQRLNKLIPPLLDAFKRGPKEHGGISGWVATKLTAFSEAEQAALAEKLAADGSLTTRYLDDLRRSQKKAAGEQTIQEVMEKIDSEKEGNEGELPERTEPEPGELQALRTTVEGLRRKLAEEAADHLRVTNELRTVLDQRNADLELARKRIRELEEKPDVAALEQTIQTQDAALTDAETTIKRLENDLARAQKRKLPHPDLARADEKEAAS